MTFTYYADGRRAQKETLSESRKFIYDGKKVLQETDGADAEYNLFTWLVTDTDEGNLSAVSDTATAQVGETATITLTWGPPLAALDPDTRYLGRVGYSDGVTLFDRTLVSINT